MQEEKVSIKTKEIFQAAESHDLKTVERYIKHDKGNINIKNCENQSLLLVALLSNVRNFDNYKQFIFYLLDQKIDTKGVADIEEYVHGGSALHLALLDQRKDVLLRLLSIPKIHVNDIADDDTSSDGHFCFTIQVSPKRSFSQRYYLERATILHYACLQGEADIISAICNTPGVNLDAKANLVLNKHLAGDFEFVNETDRQFPETDTDAESKNGEELLGWGWAARELWRVNRVRWVTPLHLAARTGHLRIVEILIKNGASVVSIEMWLWPT